jgi:uncharacterized MAPEG superfamily protein
MTNLVYVTAFTSILWVPYILNRVTVGRGVWWEMGYPDKPTVLSPWAQRLKKAHLNAIENLAVFAPLVLVAHAVGVSTPATVAAAVVFLWARITHAVSYVFAIPVLRTLAFNVGWGCVAVFAWILLVR